MMEIINVRNWKEPINYYMYFDCNEYTTNYKNQTYYYKVEKGRRWWSYPNMSDTHDEELDKELDKAFEDAYQKHLRSKKLERILQK
jgi:hypothetical protein